MPFSTPEVWIKNFCRASQNKTELTDLYHEVEKIKPKIILEIGVHQGYSIEAWRCLFPDADVIGIELHPEGIMIPKNDPKVYVWGGDSHDQLTSHEVRNLLNGDFVDFLFIDGDHTYQGVKKDFEMYAPLVKSGGIIAFHDAALKDNPLVEVYKFWEEIAGKYKNKLVTAGREESNGFKGEGTGTGIIWI